jgi:hypothetical protein
VWALSSDPSTAKKKKKNKKQNQGPGMMVPACNPTYCGGRDQEDCCLRPVQQKNNKTPSQPASLLWWYARVTENSKVQLLKD